MRAILSVMDVATVPHSDRVLTPDQQSKALQLFAHLLDLRERGERLALVHLDDALGVRPVGRRVDVALRTKAGVN